MQLAGSRVLVTGASRGIGEAIAREAAARGSTVVAVARSRELLEKLVADIRGTAYPTDLADPSQVAGLIRRVEDEVGPLDVLVNNAAVADVRAFVDANPEAIDAVYRTNLVAPVQLCRQVLPGMLERGRGHIVNVSSMAGAAACGGLVTYASTKAGLTHFTRILSMELRGTGVGTTAAELGTVPTDLLDQVHHYPPARTSFDRFYRLRLLVDVPRETVACHVIDAIERGRPFVRLPRRAVAFPVLANLSSRVARTLLTGIRQR